MLLQLLLLCEGLFALSKGYEAIFAGSCVALRTLEDVTHNVHANRALEVLRLDAEP